MRGMGGGRIRSERGKQQNNSTQRNKQKKK
jgi:hypothetical protein